MAKPDFKKCDPRLGLEVHKQMKELGIETPMLGVVGDEGEYSEHLVQRNTEELIHQISLRVADVMDILKLDREDDSLEDTPRRVAKMWVNELFYGLDYNNFPKCTTVEDKFHCDEEFVLVKNIMVKSCCEHHFMPFSNMFDGKNLGCNIAYIPNGKVLGLSKLNRVVDFFAHRPQVQERLTKQICEALCYILDTEDVIVHMECSHTCVAMRGVEDTGSRTSTVACGPNGIFDCDPPMRREFMHAIRG